MYTLCPHCVSDGKRVILFQRIGNVAVIRPERSQCTSYLIEGPFTANCGRCHRPTGVLAGAVLDKGQERVYTSA